MDSSSEQKLIDKIIKSVNEDEDLTWSEYLEDHLTFPFMAEVTHSDSRSPIQRGNKIKVHELYDFDDLYGFIMKVKFSRKTFYVPLCEMKVIDKNSPCYLPVKAYRQGGNR